jgi:hypothetical protein
MTTASQITYCTSQARTGDLLRAAAAARPPVHHTPRSTFRPLSWLGRCTGPPPRQQAAPCHS